MSRVLALRGLAILLIVASCAPIRSVPLSPPTEGRQDNLRSPEPVVVIRCGGGLCPGSITCGSEITIYGDGSYELIKYDMSKTSGVVDTVSVELLAETIVGTDFEMMRSRQFHGTCPTAYDGQACTYTFHEGDLVEELDSCETEIDEDSSLFRGVRGLEGEVWAHEKDGQ